MEPIHKMAEHYKLLGDKTRLTIIALLKEQELCVCDIVEFLATSQPNISQHLRKLKDAGIVNETRRGQWIYYALNIGDKSHLQAVTDHLPPLREEISRLNNNCC